MKKRIATLIIVIAFSGLFSACEEEGIPVPLPPPLPVGQAEDDSTLLKQNEVAEKEASPKKASDKKSKEKDPVAKKETKPAPKQSAKSDPSLCTVPCDTDSEQLSSGRYTIQIAVFPSESSAKSLVKKMSANGIKAYYAHVDNPAKLLGSYYRVRVGFFNGRTEAENFAKARLEPIGYAWWVDKRKNDKLGSTDASSFSSSNVPVDSELEAAKQAYREQLAREQAEANAGKKKKKKSNSDFDEEY